MDDESALLARSPHRIVLRVVVGVPIPHQRRDENPLEPVVVRPLHLFHCEVDVVEHGHDRESDATCGLHLTKLGDPAVVGARAGPLQFGLDAPRFQPESGAERRCVALRDPVGKEHLRDDAVIVDDLVSKVGIPSGRKLRFVARAPLVVEILDQEVLFTFGSHLGFRGDVNVELRAVLRVEVVPVLFGQEPGVAVRRDDHVAVWGRFQHHSAAAVEASVKKPLYHFRTSPIGPSPSAKIGLSRQHLFSQIATSSK